MIIFLALTSGGGHYFFDAGIIHIIAILFIILVVFRAIYHYYTYDPALEKFVHASVAAAFVFSAAHLVEFVGTYVFHQYNDAVYANVANFYMISLFLFMIGASYVLGINARWTKTIKVISLAAIFFFTALIIVLFFNEKLATLSAGSILPYVYVVAGLAAVYILLYEMFKIKKTIPLTKGFINYLMAGMAFIIVAGLIDILYDVLMKLLNMPEYISVYLGHFAFYIALSFIFLAFRELSYLGGVYEDVKKLKTEGGRR